MRRRNLVEVLTMRRRSPTGAYVIHRIRSEFFRPDGEPIRGKQAELAELTQFTKSQINHVFNSARTGSTKGVGPDFARAMAENIWGISYAQLEDDARAWAERQPDETEPEEETPLWRDDPEWAAGLVEALSMNAMRPPPLRVPDEYFEEAGRHWVTDRRPTGDAVLRLAELLWVTPRREGSS